MKGCTDASLQCNLLYVTLTLPFAKRVRPPNGKNKHPGMNPFHCPLRLLSTKNITYGQRQATGGNLKAFDAARIGLSWGTISSYKAGSSAASIPKSLKSVLGQSSAFVQMFPMCCAVSMSLHDSVRPTPVVADVPWETDWLHHTKHTAAASGTAYITLRKFHDTKHRNG